MRLQAEIHCYLCGEMTGRWEWPAMTSPRWGVFKAPDDDQGVGRHGPLERLRCRRCGGSVYLDVAEPVRTLTLPMDALPSRRGRRRKPAQRLVG